ncbi:MAG: hypothetical protein SF028_10350 [Candidatus Sumerlaeia bacterium]|nr:hypothetical protein [Candidatus Sumerlaeia bacterium]
MLAERAGRLLLRFLLGFGPLSPEWEDSVLIALRRRLRSRGTRWQIAALLLAGVAVQWFFVARELPHLSGASAAEALAAVWPDLFGAAIVCCAAAWAWACWYGERQVELDAALLAEVRRTLIHPYHYFTLLAGPPVLIAQGVWAALTLGIAAFAGVAAVSSSLEGPSGWREAASLLAAWLAFAFALVACGVAGPRGWTFTYAHERFRPDLRAMRRIPKLPLFQVGYLAFLSFWMMPGAMVKLINLTGGLDSSVATGLWLWTALMLIGALTSRLGTYGDKIRESYRIGLMWADDRE